MSIPYYANPDGTTEQKVVEDVRNGTPLTFGKHKGKTPDELLEEDVEYLAWIIATFDEDKIPFDDNLAEEALAIVSEMRDYGDVPDYGDVCDIY